MGNAKTILYNGEKRKRGGKMQRAGKKVLAVFLMAVMMIPNLTIFAKVESKDLQKPALATQFCSVQEDSKMRKKEYCDIKMDGMDMTVSGKTIERYARFWVCVRNKNARYEFNRTEAGGIPADDRTFAITLDLSKCAVGDYIISVKFIENEEHEFHKDKPQMKGIPIQVNENGAFIKEYSSIIQENQQIRSADTSFTKCYLDTSMADMSYEVRNGAKWTSNAKKKLTAGEVKALKSFSDMIVKGADTKYEKLMKIHDYIAEHVYYDRPLFERKTSKGTLSPYDLYKQIKNESSSKKAKTVCNGYSALFASLARAQKIPCRTVSGHSISIPGNTWETEANITKQDHVWNEAYVDGKWIIVDVTRDCSNVYQKNDTYPNGAYLAPEHKILRYSGFDPSAQAHAVNHLYLGYREMPELSAKKPSLSEITDTVFPVTLRWQRASGAISYRIYRAQSSSGTYQLIKTIESGKTLHYSDTSAIPKKKYYYKIQARDKNGRYTGKSSARSVTSKMPTPKILSVKKSSKSVAVKWKKLSSISEYKIYRSTKAKSGYKVIAAKESTGSEISYYDKAKLTRGRTYYYKIRAFKKGVSSSLSPYKSIKIPK